jgi:hypothetical protein
MTMIEKQKAILFAEFCGKKADYHPKTSLWTCYEDEGTIKKTTLEMFHDYEDEILLNELLPEYDPETDEYDPCDDMTDFNMPEY